MFRVIPRRSAASGVGFALLSLLAAPTAFGQTAGNQAQTSQGSSTKDDQNTGQIRFRLPTVTVTAQKESDDIQDVPVSVTAVTGETLESAGVTSVSEAAQYAPNTFFNEFTARKLSNPRFRGIGASPANPGVTTFVDGVPQFNANSSSFELLDIDQIEFVRGPSGRAVRPKHGWWPRQHHEQASVAQELDRPADAVRSGTSAMAPSRAPHRARS